MYRTRSAGGSCGARAGDGSAGRAGNNPVRTLADFEAALGGMGGAQFKRHSDALVPFIVPGSQHWVVYRVLDERAG